MKIKVYYMSGAGNTFSVIDNRAAKLVIDEARKLAPLLCNKNETNRHKTEGLMLIDKSADEKDLSVEFFNPDGSHGAMCGNGGRCAVMLAQKLNIISDDKDKYMFDMAGEEYTAEFAGTNIRLYLPAPLKITENITVPLAKSELTGGYVDVNSDHFVVNISTVPELKNTSIDEVHLDEFSIPIRHHKMFSPAGVNVNLYLVIDRQTIRLRTFERGVEGETGACGTGSVSTAIIANMKGEVAFPVKIIPPSKIPVWVDLIKAGASITACVLEGPAEVFDVKEIEI